MRGVKYSFAAEHNFHTCFYLLKKAKHFLSIFHVVFFFFNRLLKTHAVTFNLNYPILPILPFSLSLSLPPSLPISLYAFILQFNVIVTRKIKKTFFVCLTLDVCIYCLRDVAITNRCYQKKKKKVILVSKRSLNIYRFKEMYKVKILWIYCSTTYCTEFIKCLETSVKHIFLRSA